MMDPAEAAAKVAQAGSGTDDHSGPAPLCEHYELVRQGKAVGQGGQIGRLHWNQPKVARMLLFLCVTLSLCLALFLCFTDSIAH